VAWRCQSGALGGLPCPLFRLRRGGQPPRMPAFIYPSNQPRRNRHGRLTPRPKPNLRSTSTWRGDTVFDRMERRFDLVVVGTGITSAVATRCRKAGWTVAVVDSPPFPPTSSLRPCPPHPSLVIP